MTLPENFSAAGCWPNSTQELLLKAILADDDEQAIKAWQQWQDNLSIEQLDFGSQRLLPLLYHRLKSVNITHPDLKLYKGVYRQAWCRSQVMLHQILPILQTLQSNDIRVMVVKGLALGSLYYKDYGLRPMSDFDILVPTDQKDKAIELMQSLGWAGQSQWAHARLFTKQNFECDLHWHLMSDSCYTEADEDFWQAATTLKIKDTHAYTLSPADMILHICVHGAWWNVVAPLSWIVDIMMILKAQTVIDWTRLVEQTDKRRLGLPIKNSFYYLKTYFAAPIPQEVLDRLDQYSPTYSEELNYLARTSPTKERSPSAALWVCYKEYQNYVIGNNLEPSFLSFVQFLQQRWGVKKLSEFPLQTIKEVWQRL